MFYLTDILEDYNQPVSLSKTKVIAFAGANRIRTKIVIPVSYTHLDVYKRQLPYIDVEKNLQSCVRQVRNVGMGINYKLDHLTDGTDKVELSKDKKISRLDMRISKGWMRIDG